MTVSRVFKLHGWTTETNSLFFSQLENTSVQSAIEDLTVTGSGHTFPGFTAQNGSKPVIPFSTMAIETALAEFGWLGADPGNVTLYYRKVDNRGSRVANGTSEHITFLSNLNMGYIQSISAGANKAATLTGELRLLNDGTNAALIYSGAATIADTPTADENFVLGPIAHNGTEITGCDNFSIEFGAELVDPEGEILSEPTFVAVDKIVPVITFETTDLTVWSTLHQQAVASPGAFKANLIRKKPDLDRWADTDTEHINFLVEKGRFVVEEVSGDNSLARVKLYCVTKDGTTLPVVSTVNSAIDIAATT